MPRVDEIDDSNVDLEGLIYLPSRRAQFNSGLAMKSRKMTMVWNSLTLNEVNWNLTPAEPSIETTTVTQTVSANGDAMLVPN